MTSRDGLTDEPTDELTRLAALMTSPLILHDDVEAVVMVQRGQVGGMVLHQLDPEAALWMILAHAQELAKAAGVSLDVIAVPNNASGAGQ